MIPPTLMSLGLEFDLAKETMFKTWDAYKAERTPRNLDDYTEAVDACERLRAQIAEQIQMPVPELPIPE